MALPNECTDRGFPLESHDNVPAALTLGSLTIDPAETLIRRPTRTSLPRTSWTCRSTSASAKPTRPEKRPS